MKDLKKFKDFFTKSIQTILAKEEKDLTRLYNISVTMLGANSKLHHEISQMQPCGSGNNEPIIKIHDVVIIKKTVCSNSHIALVIRDKNTNIRMSSIVFNANKTPIFEYVMKQYKPEDNIQLIGHIKKNYWNGRAKLQLIIKDICVSH